MARLLNVNNLHVYYGGIHALRGIDIEVNEGEIVTIIGSNGAGKSTLLNTVSGFLKPKEGQVRFEGAPVSMAPHNIVKKGVCQVPEGRMVFVNLTVKDNLMLGAYLRTNKREIEESYEKVYTLFPRLKEREKQIAGTLSGGEQQMLAMGRGLMGDPKLLMLDEPSLGLAPIIVKTIFDIILDIKKMGKTMLLVEQNAYKALGVADRAYIMEQGKIIMSGKAKDLMSDPRIQEAYLGSGSA